LGGGGGGSGGRRAGNGLATSSSGFGGGGGGGSAQGGAPYAAGGDGGFGAGGGGAFGNGILGTNPGGQGGFGGGGGGVGGDGANIGNGAGAGGFGGGAGGSGGGGGAGLGGAIFNNGGNVTLTNCTITGNSAIAGAGGAAGGGIAGNPGQGLGGGIFNRNGNCTILNCTIDANTAAQGAGGIYSLGDGAGNTATLTMNNTICADSSNGADVIAFTNAGGASNASGSNNVITSTAIVTFTGTITASPQVSALASNGGPTQTMAIGAASPAVNAANNSLAPVTDQRSFVRPDTADIGAFEFNGALTLTPPATPPTFTSAPSATPNPAFLSQTVQFSATGTGSGTLTFTWNFGDGSSASGANVSHQFTVPGTYTVTVTLTDASGLTASQNVSVTISPTPFRVRRALFTLNSGADSASITGIIHVPSGINLAQQKITTIVGGNVQEFTFSKGRRAVSGANTLTLNAITRGGVTVDQEAAFKLKLSGNLGTAFKANAPLDANGFPTQISVQIQFGGIYYGVTLQTSFKSSNKGAKATTKTQ
jgi:PKD repeat protein